MGVEALIGRIHHNRNTGESAYFTRAAPPCTTCLIWVMGQWRLSSSVVNRKRNQSSPSCAAFRCRLTRAAEPAHPASRELKAASLTRLHPAHLARLDWRVSLSHARKST
jgi:hypothetical protein